MRWILLAVVCSIVVSCQTDATEPAATYPVIPANMPPVPYPSDNPITQQKAELGRRLFFDGRLSSSGTISCSSCHHQDKAFSDAPNQISVGIEGNQGERNAPMIVNAGYRKIFFWDGRAASLEDQAMAAFTNPIEMNADTIAVAELMRSAEYREQWVSAFGDTTITMHRTMQAIATFERTLNSANSRYDRFVRGDTAALNQQERLGMRLFFSDRTKCSACHGGQDFTDDQFHNVGLFHHYFDRGRFVITGNPEDEGKFKTPTLRNIALTPPYMATGDAETGLLNTLEEVVEHYNGGGTPFHSKDKRVKPLNLTDVEKKQLVSFLKTLTDSSVLSNSRFTKP